MKKKQKQHENTENVFKKAFKLRAKLSSNAQIFGTNEFTLHVSSGGEKEGEGSWQLFPHTEHQISHSGEKPQGSKNDRGFIEIFTLIQYEQSHTW